MNNIRARFSGRQRVALHFDPALKRTKEAYKGECDINAIVEKARKSGDMSSLLPKTQGIYSDVSNLPSYQEAMDIVNRATEAFDALPSKLRYECHNDPAEFLEKVKDVEWAIKHKLAVKRPDVVVPTPTPSQPLQTPSTGVANPVQSGDTKGKEAKTNGQPD